MKLNKPDGVLPKARALVRVVGKSLSLLEDSVLAKVYRMHTVSVQTIPSRERTRDSTKLAIQSVVARRSGGNFAYTN